MVRNILVFRTEINHERCGVEIMRRDKDVMFGQDVYANRPAIFARDAAAATKRPARFVAKKARAAVAVLVLLSSPAIAGPPYITDDPETVDYQRWEFYVFSQAGARMAKPAASRRHAIATTAFCRTLSCIFSRAPPFVAPAALRRHGGLATRSLA